MNLLKVVATAAVASLLATPGYAEPANPAGKLSLASKAQPAGTPANARSNVKSPKSSTLPLIAIGTALVVGAALLLGNSDSKPASN